jgi:dihydrofolate reductase
VTVHMIWAEAHDRVIGADGTIPWRIPEDQANFRYRTMAARGPAQCGADP